MSKLLDDINAEIGSYGAICTFTDAEYRASEDKACDGDMGEQILGHVRSYLIRTLPTLLECEFGSFLAHDPADRERFYGDAAHAIASVIR